MLSADNVSLGYGKKLILDQISVSIPSTGITVLTGPNGAGKSTLLHLLAGYRQPLQGQVLLDGKDIRKDLSGRERAERIGVVPQNIPMFAGSSVMDFMLLKAVLHHSRVIKEYKAKSETMLESMGLHGFSNRDMDRLSAGERQRILLAAALVYEPEYLLLDEPLSASDPEHVIDTFVFLRHLPFPAGILMVTHDLQTAMNCGDRVILLDHGKIYADGVPEQVLTEENIKHVYHCESQIHALAAGKRTILLYK